MTMTIGEKIIKARKSKKLTQEDLASLVKVDRNVIGRLERNGIQLTTDLAIMIADTLDISLDYLAREDYSSPTDAPKTTPEKFATQLAQLEKLSPEDLGHVISVLDAFVIKAQLQSIIK